MSVGLLPRDVKKASDLLEADPARAWTVDSLAACCGVPRRTLEKHFRRYVNQTPVEFLRAMRLDRARRQLLTAPPQATVTQIAIECGFNHFGRFAAWYRERYGENPLATLRRSRDAAARPASSSLTLSAMQERPALAVLPFDLLGPDAHRAAGISEEIAVALGRLRWVAVGSPPKARYHLRGKIRTDHSGQLRATVTLLDASSGLHLWADCWDGRVDDAFEFEDRVSAQVTRALQRKLRDAEIDRACRKEPGHLTAWELTMRALPRLLAIEPAAERVALELLEQAMELEPQDALPVSMAAWCHGLRAGHHFTAQPDKEREKASILAARASSLGTGDPLAQTMLAGGHTLAHDLDAAAVHAGSALALDGGSVWAWGRSAWIHAYRGEAADAIERFQIARNLAPSDTLSFLWSVGIAAAHFQAARYEQAIRWYRRGLAEQPAAVWINRFLTASLVLAGRKEEAKRSLGRLVSAFPALTIAQVRAGLPHPVSFVDILADGLESAGMRVC
ncbi:MAG TPA: helix-turn-helix domain-containing protein [Stellaceae bacterium]|nr:helix-turn-helix domain-containing protein [Stellaceae bacterium]